MSRARGAGDAQDRGGNIVTPVHPGHQHGARLPQALPCRPGWSERPAAPGKRTAGPPGIGNWHCRDVDAVRPGTCRNPGLLAGISTQGRTGDLAGSFAGSTTPVSAIMSWMVLSAGASPPSSRSILSSYRPAHWRTSSTMSSTSC